MKRDVRIEGIGEVEREGSVNAVRNTAAVLAFEKEREVDVLAEPFPRAEVHHARGAWALRKVIHDDVVSALPPVAIVCVLDLDGVVRDEPAVEQDAAIGGANQ